MAPSIPAPTIRIPIELLTRTTFAQFGTVIENPHNSPAPASHQGPLPASVTANQGSALKLLDVTRPSNLYALAPSRKPAKPVMNMFICSPRDLRPNLGNGSGNGEGEGRGESMPSSWGDIDFDEEDEEGRGGRRELFDVRILERHPFTTQTFIPMGLDGDANTTYVVIVAPTLPASSYRSKRDGGERPPPYPTNKPHRKSRSIKDIFARARPPPYAVEAGPPSTGQISRLHPEQRPKGPGLPDLKNLRAFVATGNQAVTYGAGTWHAPMVVVGERPIDFVVVQFANDVGNEDCQEVELQSGAGAEEGVVVMVDQDREGRVLVKAGVGSVKAKL